MIENFRAAAQWLNERRDTISYAAGAAVIFGYAEWKHIPLPTALQVGMLTAAARELVRGICWEFRSQTHAAIDIGGEVFKTKKLSKTALAGKTLLFGAVPLANLIHGGALSGVGTLWAGAALLGAAAYTQYVGGPLETAKAYRAMWNFPNKKEGDGGNRPSSPRRRRRIEIKPAGNFGWGGMQPATIPVSPNRYFTPSPRNALAID